MLVQLGRAHVLRLGIPRKYEHPPHCPDVCSCSCVELLQTLPQLANHRRRTSPHLVRDALALPVVPLSVSRCDCERALTVVSGHGSAVPPTAAFPVDDRTDRSGFRIGRPHVTQRQNDVRLAVVETPD